MKALSLIALFFAAFLIFLGISSRKTSGTLSNTVIIGGAVIAGFVAIIWAITFIKEKKGK
ncbi:MAG: hypothetical protein H0U50_04905 [Pyrinomonadaceae bacterium]|nr:hypothetical protein [Pyrinomonadaceae bacterium]